jgi:hypothetical protein
MEQALRTHGRHIKGIVEYLSATRLYEQQQYEDSIELLLKALPLPESIYLASCGFIRQIQKNISSKQNPSVGLQKRLPEIHSLLKSMLATNPHWSFYSEPSKQRALQSGPRILKALEQAMEEASKKEQNWNLLDSAKTGEIFDATW